MNLKSLITILTLELKERNPELEAELRDAYAASYLFLESHPDGYDVTPREMESLYWLLNQLLNALDGYNLRFKTNFFVELTPA